MSLRMYFGSVVRALPREAMSPAPNKPMVRTATRALAEPALPSGRPHIGQPLDRIPMVAVVADIFCAGFGKDR